MRQVQVIATGSSSFEFASQIGEVELAPRQSLNHLLNGSMQHWASPNDGARFLTEKADGNCLALKFRKRDNLLLSVCEAAFME